ncbi:MAG TPA: hypothetical protein ENF69_02195 [Euryarchaeota archaeon]|nr:MAG: hypothetical protein DRN40_03025 [Thermoplasmata archaeon]HDD59739.1 hypothetical protein [Euryarchaeota archaeon]
MKDISGKFRPDVERADLVLLLTSSEEVLKSFASSPLKERLVVIVDEKNPPGEEMEGLKYARVSLSAEDALYVTRFLEKVLFRAFIEYGFSKEGKVVVLADHPFKLTIELNLDDIPLAKAIKELSQKIDPVVMEAILRVVFDIHREGREGKSIGTLFVVGDVEKVLSYTQQLIINPYQGQPENLRKIQNPENWESIKELAQLDGAFVLDRSGRIYCAGAYIMVKNGVKAHPGFGGRHLAAASITQETDAVAIALSSSGTMRIFERGRVIFHQELG